MNKTYFAYKGMTWTLTSEFGTPFEVGKEYESKDEAKCQRGGFHGCHNPWHVLMHYGFRDSRFCLVELSGQTDSCDQMVTGTRMKILCEFTPSEFIYELIEKADYRMLNYEVCHSKEDDAFIRDEYKHIVVASEGNNAHISITSEGSAVASSGNDAVIKFDKFSDGNLVVSTGNNAVISGLYNSRIIAIGRNAKVECAQNCLVMGAYGTEVSIGDRTYTIGKDGLKPGRYYLFSDKLKHPKENGIKHWVRDCDPPRLY